jgi:formylglycine-generating enzyme required for sulfatase activity
MLRLAATLLISSGLALSLCADQTLRGATSGAENVTGSAPVEGKPHKIDDLALELLWIPPGTFLMGTAPDQLTDKSERPQTQVTLSHGFWLGRTEVTQAQYEAIVGSNPSTFKSVGPSAPVERVSWLDAVAYCRKLTERERAVGRLPTGFVYTLPTESQWEYACRAGTTGEYPGDPETMAWHRGNSDGTTHPVASKAPNAWGLYDMSGNVLEWCLDWYGEYPGGAVVDPTGPDHGYYRMARGGSWRADMKVGRSAARAGGSAGRLDYTMGFRLALQRERPSNHAARPAPIENRSR